MMQILEVTSVFVALLTTILSPTSAFIIPRSLPNGKYRASYDANGTQIIERLTLELMLEDMNEVIAAGLVDIVEPPQSSNSSSMLPGTHQYKDEKKRRSHCACHQNMDHSDTDDAAQLMRDLINDQPSREAYVPIGKGYFQTYETVITHICTPPRNEGVTPVNVGTFDYALKFLAEHCGAYTPGVYIHGVTTGRKGQGMNGAAAYIGYNNEETWDERKICQRMDEPKADHC
jgi:hypothetical protein